MKEIFYMKEWLKHILPLACIGLMSFLWVSCSSDDNDGEPTPPTVESEKRKKESGHTVSEVSIIRLLQAYSPSMKPEELPASSHRRI